MNATAFVISPITRRAFRRSFLSPINQAVLFSSGLRLPAMLIAISVLSACGSMPREAFRLSETSLATRELQTREYSAISDTEILSASMAVLQDMGYAIDELEKPLGVLSASKRADASNDFEAFGTLALDSAKCTEHLEIVDRHHKIR